MGKEVFITEIAVFNYTSAPEESTKVPVNRDEGRTNKKWLQWGDTDNFPKNLWEQVEKSNVASSALAIHRDAHFGNGLIYFKKQVDDLGKKIKVPVIDQAIEDFISKSLLNSQYYDTIDRDFEIYNLAVLEFVFESKTSMKVSRVFAHDAQNFRYEKPDEKSGKVNKGYISSNFPNATDEEITALPLIDPFNIEKSVKSGKGFRFLYVIKSLSPGKNYYPKPNWYSVISSGWLDIVLSVPAAKKALYKNAATIKYFVEINNDYWPSMFPNWDAMTPKEQKAAKKELRDDITKYLSGVDNSGKILSAPFYADRNGKEISSIKITPIKDLIDNDKYLPDASAGNDEIMFGFQLDPAIIGISPGASKGSDGSGSNKRIVWNFLQARKSGPRRKTVEPLVLVSNLHNWGVDWGYEDTLFQTLDENPTGKQSVLN